MQERRRIAVVIPKYGTVGGAEGFAAELTERVACHPEFEVHVFANLWVSSSKRLTFHRVPIVKFPRSLISPSFAFFAGRRIAAAGPFDIVHTHDRIFAADVYTMHGIPHRWWIREVRKKRLSLFDRSLAGVEDQLVLRGGCSRFLAVSGLVRNIFLEEYPVDPSLVRVIHPGVDREPYEKMNRDTCRQTIRGQYGIGLDEPLILFVSMNFDVKGLDYLLGGLSLLRRSNPDASFKLLVAGHGDEKKYRHLASEQGIADRVIFAGAVEREKLPEFYLAADLYAMLSRFDTFGMVVLEAMAAGLPVLISGRVGAKDLVEEGGNGFVIEEPANSDLVADKIGMLLSRELREGMRRAALKTAAANSWDVVVNKVLNIYRELLKDQRFVNSKMPHP
ncbi:MAG: glycosyltransferase family 4 protein [Syntrophobacterales bacterium]|nr:glycosyltransferase family 4 protein [Syntrophobacterales bacterium]